MKSYDETVQSVFARINEYEVKKMREMKIMKRAATVLCCLCLVAIMGVGAWHIAMRNTQPAGIDLGETTGNTEEGTTDNTETTGNTEEVTTENTETTGTTPNHGVGGPSRLCTVHHNDYHSVVGPMGRLVNGDDVMKLYDIIKDETPTNGCTEIVTIKKILDYFEIKKEDIMTVDFLRSTPEYNVDFLYSASEEEIDEFFRDLDYISVVNGYMEVNSKICKTILEKYGKELESYGIIKVQQIIVPEVAKLLDIEKEEIEAIVKDYNDWRVSKDLAPYAWDGNYELIYGDESDWTTELLIKAGIDTDKKCLTQYELMEKFCRIGREMDRDRAMGTEK